MAAFAQQQVSERRTNAPKNCIGKWIIADLLIARFSCTIIANEVIEVKIYFAASDENILGSAFYGKKMFFKLIEKRLDYITACINPPRMKSKRKNSWCLRFS